MCALRDFQLAARYTTPTRLTLGGKTGLMLLEVWSIALTKADEMLRRFRLGVKSFSTQ